VRESERGEKERERERERERTGYELFDLDASVLNAERQRCRRNYLDVYLVQNMTIITLDGL